MSKKLFSLLFAAVTACALAAAPAAASAEPLGSSGAEASVDTVSESAVTTDASYMTKTQAAKALRAGMSDLDDEITFTMPKESGVSFMDQFLEIYDMACAHTGDPFGGDYLRYSWRSWVVTNCEHSSYYDVTAQFNFYATKSQESVTRYKIADAVDALDLDSAASSYQKCKAIHDWIMNNREYVRDSECWDNGPYIPSKTKLVGVGFSRLYYAMATMAGVDTRIIAGIDNTNNDLWCISKMPDGYYYNIDLQWGRESSYVNSNTGKMVISRSYFLKSDSWYYHTRYGSKTGQEPRDVSIPDYTTDEFYAQYPMGASDYNSSKTSTVTLKNRSVSYSATPVAVATPVTTGSTGTVTVKYYRDAACTKLTGTTIATGKADNAGAAPRSAGTYYAKATLAAKGGYPAAISNVAKIVISKVAQPITATVNKPSTRYSTTVTKTSSVNPLKIAGNKATVTYALVSAVNSKGASVTSHFSVGSSKGELKVKPNTELGTYTLKIKVTAPATTNYKSFSKTYTVKAYVLKGVKKIVLPAADPVKTYAADTTGAYRYMLGTDKTYTLPIHLQVDGSNISKNSLSCTLVSAVKTSNNKDVSSKFSVSSKGVLTSKHGLLKGTYKIKVKITSASTSHYKEAEPKTLTVTVKVQ